MENFTVDSGWDTHFSLWCCICKRLVSEYGGYESLKTVIEDAERHEDIHVLAGEKVD